MSHDAVLAETRGPVALVTLNRPQKLNALDYALIDRLMAVLDSIEADEDVRAVILTGSDVLQISALSPSMPIRTEPVTLVEAERDHIRKALEESNWVVGGKSGAAARLGVKRTTLIDKMRKRGLVREMVQGGI